jgi:signal transduction histidine kinase
MPRTTSKPEPDSLQDPKLAIVVIDAGGRIMKANGPARKVLVDGDQTTDGSDLGQLLAGYFTRDSKTSGWARISLQAPGQESRSLTIIVRPDAAPAEPHLPTAPEAAKETADHRVAEYIAHELKNPLGVVLGLSRALRWRDERLSVQDKFSALESIEAEAERSLLIVEALLRLAQNQHSSDTKTSVVPLHAVLQHAVADHRRRYPDRVITLEGDSPVYALADSLNVELAIGNLLSNAEKYSPPDERIEIHVHHEGSWSAILVVNRGVVLSPDRYERLWHLYQRGPDVPPDQGGAGIGLSLCKELVERTGGRVWAGPTEAGSVFAVCLPTPSEGAFAESLPQDGTPPAQASVP